jgi:hypothetical protein
LRTGRHRHLLQGAGPQPTASAILGDIVRAARGDAGTIQSFDTHASTPARIAASEPTSQFVHVVAPADELEPQRVLAILNAHGIATSQLEFHRDAVVFITAHGHLTAIANACAAINHSACPPFVAPIMD